jgi:hypothetical protein
VWKGCLVHDLENFDFFNLEIARTRENRLPAQSGVVGVSVAKGSVTADVCVAVIGNNHATKVWTASGTTKDCLVFVCGNQRKSARRDVVRIRQREKETLLAVIHPGLELRGDSHSTGVNPPKMFPSVSKITVSVFGWPSQRLWNWEALKASRLPRHSSLNCFPRNTARIAGKYEMIAEPSSRSASLALSLSGLDYRSAAAWLPRSALNSDDSRAAVPILRALVLSRPTTLTAVTLTLPV